MLRQPVKALRCRDRGVKRGVERESNHQEREGEQDLNEGATKQSNKTKPRQASERNLRKEDLEAALSLPKAPTGLNTQRILFSVCAIWHACCFDHIGSHKKCRLAGILEACEL